MVDKLPVKELEFSAVILKQLWSRRNMVIFDKKYKSPSTVLQRAITLLENYQSTQTSKTLASFNSSTNLGNQVSRWQPPGVNQMKINWDATVDEKRNSTGLGMGLSEILMELCSTLIVVANHLPVNQL